MVSPFIIKDASWIRQSFAVDSSSLDAADVSRRTFTTASLKFTDTSLGGNFAINPPPQFTRTADIRPASNRLANSPGMGRYYSEAIDDNSQIIYMRFGVPEFNSLTTFFTGFYNTGAGQLARTGRATGIFYAMGRAAGFVVSIMNWLPLAVHLLGVGWRFFTGKPSSKFYYLKPTMPLYWNAVQTIVNQIAVNRGIVPRIGQQDANGNDVSGTVSGLTTNTDGSSSPTDSVDLSQGYQWTDKDRQTFAQNSPDIFTSGGTVNVYAMATRAARLHYKQLQAIEQAASEGQQDLTTAFTSVMQNTYGDSPPDYMNYLAAWAGNASGSGGTAQAQPAPDTTSDDGDSSSSSTEALISNVTANDGFDTFMKAELDDGSQFVGFRVNATGSVGESFSSSVADSPIAEKINSMSSSSRSTNFDLAGGNLFGDNPIGATVQGILGAAKDFAAGVSQSLQISGLAALAGAAFVDIPKHWESSSASVNRGMNYTINLVSPYGNPMSQLINIHIPLAMILAAALPLSTGKQSYTSPFLCEVYDRGRCQTRLGIVDSLSITRGTGNLGFTNEGHVMAVDVSFSILDLSSVMHMPISQGINFAAAAAASATGAIVGGPVGAGLGFAVSQIASGTFDEDTIYTDYLAVLGGMGLADQIYPWRKYKLNLTRQMTNWNTWFSWAHFASYMGNTPPGRLVSMIYKGVEH
jgi:hypothetical protein